MNYSYTCQHDRVNLSYKIIHIKRTVYRTEMFDNKKRKKTNMQNYNQADRKYIGNIKNIRTEKKEGTDKKK